MMNDFQDPLVPILAEIDVVRARQRFAPAADPRPQLSRCLALLFLLYAEEYLDDAPRGPEKTAAILDDFLDFLERLSTTSPSPTELSTAPLLEGWCAASIDPTPRLFGRVTGHPRIREHARTYTSPYFQVNPGQGWARTWSRYYRLGRYDRYFFGELMIDGVIPPGSELIEL